MGVRTPESIAKEQASALVKTRAGMNLLPRIYHPKPQTFTFRALSHSILVLFKEPRYL